jgi:hypothetical protein
MRSNLAAQPRQVAFRCIVSSTAGAVNKNGSLLYRFIGSQKRLQPSAFYR